MKRLGTFLDILFVTLMFFLGLVVFPAVSVIQPLNDISSLVTTTVFVPPTSTSTVAASVASSTLPTLYLSVANTEAEREQGLSDTPSLPADSGKWFVFQTPDYQGFWMKDMAYPLDMIWMDSNMQVQYIVADALPASYPEAFVPTVKSLYVLEVNAGYAAAHGIEAGDILTNKVNLAFSPNL